MARSGFRQGYFSKRRRRVVLALSRNQDAAAAYSSTTDSSVAEQDSLISENEFQEQEEMLLEEQSRFLEEIAVNSEINSSDENRSSTVNTIEEIDPFIVETSANIVESIEEIEQPEEAVAAFPFEGVGLNTIRELVQQDEPAVWAFLGDESTMGIHISRDQRSFVDLFGERLRWELRRFPDVTINAGIPNADSSSCLQHAEERCFRFRPDAVLIMIGIHDAVQGEEGLSKFKRNLVELISKVRNANATPVLQTPCCVSYEGMNSIPALPAYVDAIREVAGQADIPLIDHWLLTQECPEPGVELSDAGHKKVTANLLHEFDLFDANSDVCKMLS